MDVSVKAAHSSEGEVVGVLVLPCPHLPETAAHRAKRGGKDAGAPIPEKKFLSLCIAWQKLIRGGDLLPEMNPIFPFCTPASGRQSGCGLLPAKKRLADACGKPNSLLAPPEGG